MNYITRLDNLEQVFHWVAEYIGGSGELACKFLPLSSQCCRTAALKNQANRLTNGKRVV